MPSYFENHNALLQRHNIEVFRGVKAISVDINNQIVKITDDKKKILKNISMIKA